MDGPTIGAFLLWLGIRFVFLRFASALFWAGLRSLHRNDIIPFVPQRAYVIMHDCKAGGLCDAVALVSHACALLLSSFACWRRRAGLRRRVPTETPFGCFGT